MSLRPTRRRSHNTTTRKIPAGRVNNREQAYMIECCKPVQHEGMNVELLVVGAHNGTKINHIIQVAKDRGAVVLVEPIPFLAKQLRDNLRGVPNLYFVRGCVAPVSGPTTFFAPKPEANSVAAYGDQLGPLNQDHAAGHNPDFKQYVDPIEVQGITFTDLIDEMKITSIRHLLTDTEGYDCILLQTFPFSRIRPQTITFEFKHADGVNKVGKNLALLLLKLDALDYNVHVIDAENLHAVSRP